MTAVSDRGRGGTRDEEIEDEGTVVEDQPREPTLRLVR